MKWRKLYPHNWEKLARACKERARWHCEECGISDGARAISRRTGVVYEVHLAAAHIDHDPWTLTLDSEPSVPPVTHATTTATRSGSGGWHWKGNVINGLFDAGKNAETKQREQQISSCSHEGVSTMSKSFRRPDGTIFDPHHQQQMYEEYPEETYSEEMYPDEVYSENMYPPRSRDYGQAPGLFSVLFQLLTPWRVVSVLLCLMSIVLVCFLLLHPQGFSLIHFQ